MQKLLKKFYHPKLSQSTICLIYSTLITLAYNFCFIKYKFSIIAASLEPQTITTFIGEILFSYFIIFTALYAASYNKITFKIILFLLIVLSVFSVYTFNQFHVTIDSTIIGDLVENIDNFGNVVPLKTAFFYFIPFFFLPFLFLSRVTQINDSSHFTKISIAIIFVFFTAILANINHAKRKGFIFAYPPLKLVESSLQYYKDIRFAIKNKGNLLPINDAVQVKILPQKVENLKIILVIGESARAKNFAIDGYERHTTPMLQKIKNLVSFKDVTPCNNITNYSVTCMLSRHDKKDFVFPAPEESIIKIFENLNFKTRWFSSQKAFGDNNSLILLGSQAQKFYFSDKLASKIGGNMIYDEYLLDDLKPELASVGDDFIILHTQGSHFLFNERYPDKFKIFTPACEEKNLEKCAQQEVVNAYDNSILYTDYFLAQTIEMLKNENALLIYVSDHGQFLGEDGIYYHGPQESVGDKEHKVPMFLWMSDKLLAHPYYREALKRAASRADEKLSHDNLFDSLLGCAGIGFAKKNESVCR